MCCLIVFISLCFLAATDLLGQPHRSLYSPNRATLGRLAPALTRACGRQNVQVASGCPEADPVVAVGLNPDKRCTARGIVDVPSFVRVACIHNASYLGGLAGLVVALVVSTRYGVDRKASPRDA